MNFSFQCPEHSMEIKFLDFNQGKPKGQRVQCIQCKLTEPTEIETALRDWKTYQQNELKMKEEEKKQYLKPIIELEKQFKSVRNELDDAIGSIVKHISDLKFFLTETCNRSIKEVTLADDDLNLSKLQDIAETIANGSQIEESIIKQFTWLDNHFLMMKKIQDSIESLKLKISVFSINIQDEHKKEIEKIYDKQCTQGILIVYQSFNYSVRKTLNRQKLQLINSLKYGKIMMLKLGLTLTELNEPEKALSSYDKATQNTRYFFKAIYHKGKKSAISGITLQSLDRQNEALSCFDEVIQINKNHFLSYNKRGNRLLSFQGEALMSLNRYEEAIQSFDEAISRNPRYSSAFNNKGQALHHLNRSQESINFYDQAIQINPNYYQAYKNKGQALESLNCFEEALLSYDEAIKLNPEYSEAFNSKGSLLRKSNRTQESLNYFDLAIKFSPQYFEAYHNKGLALDFLNEFEDAIEQYDKAILFNPSFYEAYNNKGLALDSLNRYEDAILSFSEAIRINPAFSLAFNNKGLDLDYLGRYEEAIECFNQAINLDPSFYKAYNNKGLALDSLNRYEEAIQCFDQAIHYNPTFQSAYNNKGLALDCLNRQSEAIICYDKAIEINPKFYQAFNNKGSSLDSLNRFNEAIQCFNQAITINPNDCVAYNSKGSTLENMGYQKEAFEYYCYAIKLNSTFFQAYNNKGLMLMDLNEFEKALLNFNKAIEINPKFYKAYNNKGLMLHNAQAYDLALVCFDKAIELNSQYYQAFSNKGEFYSYLGLTLKYMNKFVEALQCFNSALEINPTYEAAIKDHIASNLNCRSRIVVANSSIYRNLVSFPRGSPRVLIQLLPKIDTFYVLLIHNKKNILLKMYYVCKYDGHPDNYDEVKYICLKLECDQQRKVCQNHIGKHLNHAINCVDISFLPLILEKELCKLQQCCQVVTKQTIKFNLEQKYQNIKQVLNDLVKQEQSIGQIEISSLLIKCYNCQIENEVINIAWEESQGIKNKIRDIYSFEETKYLIKKHIQAGAMLKLIQNYSAARSMYQNALKLCQEHHNEESDEIRQQLTHLHLQTENFISVVQILNLISKSSQNLSISQISSFFSANLLFLVKKPYFFFIKEFFIEMAKYFYVKEVCHCILLFICDNFEETIIYCSFEIKKHQKQEKVALRYAAIMAFFQLRKFKEAMDLVEESIEIHPQDYIFVSFKSLFLIYQEKFDQFQDLLQSGKLRILENTISFNKILSKISAYQVIYNFQREYYHECVKQLTIFQQIEPSNTFMEYLKTLILIEINKDSQKGVLINSSIYNNDRKKIAELRLNEQYQKALQLIHKNLSKFQNSQELWIDKITVLYEMGNLEAALSEIVSLKFNENHYEIRTYLIQSLAEFKLQNYESAYQNLQKLKQIFKHSATFHFNFLEGIYYLHEGQFLFSLNRFDEAEECFTVCCEKNSEFSKGYFCKGNFLQKRAILMCYKGQLDKAVSLFDKCLSLNENFYAAIYNKGIALMRSNNMEAEKCFTLTLNQFKRSQILIVFCKLFQGGQKYGESIAILNKITQYRRYVQIIKCAIQIISGNYDQAQNILNLYMQNQQNRKASTDRMSDMCRGITISQIGMILLKTKQTQEFQEWASKAKNFTECSDFSKRLDDSLSQNNQSQDQLTQYFLNSLLILKYDTEILKNIPNKIDLFHGLIDLQHTFAYYIQNLFN